MDPTRSNIFLTSDVRKLINTLTSSPKDTDVNDVATRLATSILKKAETLILKGKELDKKQILMIYNQIKKPEVRRLAKEIFKEKAKGLIDFESPKPPPKENTYLTEDVQKNFFNLQHGDVADTDLNAMMLASSIWGVAQEELKKGNDIDTEAIREIYELIVDDTAKEKALEILMTTSDGVINLTPEKTEVEELIYFTEDVQNNLSQLLHGDVADTDLNAMMLASSIWGVAQEELKKGNDIDTEAIRDIYELIVDDTAKEKALEVLTTTSEGMINLTPEKTEVEELIYFTEDVQNNLSQLLHGDVADSDLNAMMLASSIWGVAQEELKRGNDIDTEAIRDIYELIVDDTAKDKALEVLITTSEGMINLAPEITEVKGKEPAVERERTTRERIENTLSGRNRFKSHSEKLAKYIDRIADASGEAQVKPMRKLARFVFQVITEDLSRDVSLTKLKNHINDHLSEVDEVYQCIEDSSTKRDAKEILSLEKEGLIELIKPEDIVCDMSQGFFEGGRAACASNCMVAAERFLFGPVIESEEDIYDVIKEGIKIHKDRGFDEEADFSEVVNKRADYKKEQAIIPYQPKKKDWFEPTIAKEMKISMLNLFATPAYGDPATDFLSRLEVINEAAELPSTMGLVCGVITCRGETIVVGLDDDGKPLLFDSHGRKYKGMDKGASLLKFESMDDLAKHLSENVFKGVKEPFTIHYLVPENWRQSNRRK